MMTLESTSAEMRRPDGSADRPSRPETPKVSLGETPTGARRAIAYGEAMVYAGAPSLSPTRYCPPPGGRTESGVRSDASPPPDRRTR
jgi:hypothetical protein